MSKSKIKIVDSLKGYDLVGESYDEQKGYLDSFEQEHILQLLNEVQGKKILDVGAGTGRISIPLSDLGGEVFALDSSEEMLKVLKRKKPHITTILGDAEHMPFKNNMFDIVLATFMIVHLKDPTRFFDEAYRVLKPGGQLVVTNINQKEAPAVKTKEGKIKIESYYHRPEKIMSSLKNLAFSIEKELFVKERELWINQLIVASK